MATAASALVDGHTYGLAAGWWWMPSEPLLLGRRLGPRAFQQEASVAIIERSVRKALIISDGNPAIFVQSPLAVGLAAGLWPERPGVAPA